MAGLLDMLFGGSGQGALGGSQTWAQANAGGPIPPASSAAPAPKSNPFGSALMASDAPGIFGMLGRLSGNPTTDEITMQRLGGQQAQGLAGLQKRITGGMPVQQAIVDFIGSPEGQQFFGSSQDPIGAIKGYLQLSQKPADKFSTIGPGSAVLNESTGEVGATQPTAEAQNVDKFMGLADLSPEESKLFGRAMLAKTSQPQNPTQKEDAVQSLVSQGIIDPIMGKKILAGVIQLYQPRDAAGNPLGPPIAADLTKMMQSGNPQDVQMVPVGGKNGGPAGDLPQGSQVGPDGTPARVPGEIIFGSGVVGNAGATFGGIFGNIDPSMAAPVYNSYKTALATINSDVQNLLSVNRNLSAEMKTYAEMVDKDGWASNPVEQGVALLNLHDMVDRRSAYLSTQLSNPDPKITGSTKDRMSQELANLQKLQQDLPDRESLNAAILKAQAGEGSISQGIGEAGKHVGQAVKSLEKTGNQILDTSKSATGAAEQAVAPEGGKAPVSFKSEQEAAAAAKAGTIKPGDRIIVNGVSGTWSE